jgi:hypothetical protein
MYKSLANIALGLVCGLFVGTMVVVDARPGNQKVALKPEEALQKIPPVEIIVPRQLLKGTHFTYEADKLSDDQIGWNKPFTLEGNVKASFTNGLRVHAPRFPITFERDKNSGELHITVQAK